MARTPPPPLPPEVLQRFMQVVSAVSGPEDGRSGPRLAVVDDGSAHFLDDDGELGVVALGPGREELFFARIDALADSTLSGRLPTLSFLAVTGDAEVAARVLAHSAKFGLTDTLNLIVVPLEGEPRLHDEASRSLTVARALNSLQATPADPQTFYSRTQAALLRNERASQELQEFAESYQSARTPATFGLIGLFVVVYLLEELWGGSSFLPTLVRMGGTLSPGEGMTAADLLLDGPQRLLAAATLHGGIVHLAMNGLVTWQLGRHLERLLGPARLLLLFVLSAVCGSLLATLVGGGSVTVGASGGLSGFFAAAAWLTLSPWSPMPALVKRRLRSDTMGNLLLLVLISTVPQVSWAGHLGGFLGGLVLGLAGLLTAARSPGVERALQGLAGLAGIGLLTSVLSAWLTWAPWELTAETRWQEVRAGDLVVAVPSSLGEAAVEDKPTLTSVVAGRLRKDPAVLVVTVDRRPLPGTEGPSLPPEVARQLFEALAIPETGFTLDQGPELRTLDDGRELVEARQIRSDGLVAWQAIAPSASGLVRVELLAHDSRPESKASWFRDLLDRMVLPPVGD